MTNISVTITVEIDHAEGSTKHTQTIPNVATGDNPRYFATDARIGMTRIWTVMERALVEQFGAPTGRRSLGA